MGHGPVTRQPRTVYKGSIVVSDTPPTRQAIQERNLKDAKAVNKEAGYSIQNQVWSIVPRSRGVNSSLQATPAAQDVLVEIHPEVCFFGLKRPSVNS